jgi:hypothetical protein
MFADVQVWSKTSLKSCRYEVAEVLSSNWGIVIADIQKKLL